MRSGPLPKACLRRINGFYRLRGPRGCDIIGKGSLIDGPRCFSLHAIRVISRRSPRKMAIPMSLTIRMPGNFPQRISLGTFAIRASLLARSHSRLPSSGTTDKAPLPLNGLSLNKAGSRAWRAWSGVTHPGRQSEGSGHYSQRRRRPPRSGLKPPSRDPEFPRQRVQSTLPTFQMRARHSG
jgi:hypothetical protein